MATEAIDQLTWTTTDTNRAQQIWGDYTKNHDLTERMGQTAGIDPRHSRIWFGESILDVVMQRDADGYEAPLFFIRVGEETYYRKGGRA